MFVCRRVLDAAAVLAMKQTLSNPLPSADPLALAGRRVAFVGKLAAVGRRNARQWVRDHGGHPCERHEPGVDLVVIGEDALASLIDGETIAADGVAIDASGVDGLGVDGPSPEVISETELWQRLGLVDDQHIHRLYTPAMLADLIKAPVTVIRRWHRRGLIVPARVVRRLPYFDFQEVATARRLAELVAAGVSPQAIEKKLEQLARLYPGIQRPLAQLSAIVEGKQILLRQGDGLIAPGGQLWFDFDADPPSVTSAEGNVATLHTPDGETPSGVDSAGAVAVGNGATLPSPPSTIPAGPITSEELCDLAADLEDAGELDAALEMLRAALAAGGPRPESCFQLAELLYRLGDLAGARERYYMAIELDEDYVEARANLGCVLEELGQKELAMAAFRGALAYHAGYPDAHYHLARMLVESGRASEATQHWREFLHLAPESPWAEEARQRLDDGSPIRSE